MTRDGCIPVLSCDRGAVAEMAARLGAVLAARTDPVTVVAYGAAGTAALRAAFSSG